MWTVLSAKGCGILSSLFCDSYTTQFSALAIMQSCRFTLILQHGGQHVGLVINYATLLRSP